ncbi:hypothetical protein [Alienimonas chondri]|uniref:Lipoprotein n=1 Tax=Alienimonas chondri TaxID=2681879 RepID=A0ABX1VBR8_9PLAN|nr:hypothetical protein [Alienimonas chondri]NNJ25555.1 hypothetical protein [Alienimonas chondri]
MIRLSTLSFAVLLGSALSGCASLALPVPDSLPDWLPGDDDEGPVQATAANPVTQVAGFWRPAEDTGPNGRPVRGFAGKILLFPAQSRGDEPIAARGSVRVSLYDQTGGSDKLIHQYDLPPDAWETHAAHSNLGVGYEVFLPYMSDDPRRIRCGLRIRFIPEYENGVQARPVFSALESCVLDEAVSQRRPSAYPEELMATRHGLRTETIRPVPVERPAMAARRDSGVMPASAERAYTDRSSGVPASAADGLTPEMRARIEAALAERSRRTATGRHSAAVESPASRAPDAGPGRRFTLTPADGSGADGSNPNEQASHPLGID